MLRRPPVLRRPLSGSTATWRVLKNAVWFERGMRTHIDRCCRLPSSPPANTDHTHKWLLQAQRSETTRKHNSTPFSQVLWLLPFSSLAFPRKQRHKVRVNRRNRVTGVETGELGGERGEGGLYLVVNGGGWTLQRRCKPSIPSAE